MKSKIAVLAATGAILLSAATVFAKASPSPNGNGPAGQSKRAHLYLYEKDSAWDIVEGGAWGKMAYDRTGDMFDYVFNGHRLEAEEGYTLIYYPDPWPGDGLICLGDEMANKGGEVNIKGEVGTGNLPAMSDENYNHWNISGDWLLDFASGTGNRRFVDLVQKADGSVVGTFEHFSGGMWKHGGTLVGNVSGNTVNLYYDRSPYSTYNGDFVGTIDEAGMSGTFTDSNDGTYDWSTAGEPSYINGAKIWLVQSGDVNCDTQLMTGWNPDEYLFEYDLINFVTE